MKPSYDSIGNSGKHRKVGTCTRCPAAGSLKIALLRAVRIIRLEYKIPDNVDFPCDREANCSSIRAWWKEWTTRAASCYKVNSRRGRRLAMMLKSCVRLFDVPCRSCDKILSGEAKRDWITSVGKATPSDSVPTIFELGQLRLKVRHLIRGWGKRLAAARTSVEEPVLGDYVPGVQGCAEVATLLGGTLAVPEDGPFCKRNAVRLGCAKTKGKFRVVTMQSAEVKRVLTPLHNALYGHISGKSWCVRGDVLKEDFEEIVNDCKDGESYISGDYTAATNKIYNEAVRTIVDEISRTSQLTDLEREVFVESFTDMEWFNLQDSGPMLRGSPMGSLVNFPILCLLNKACFEIACDNVYGPHSGKVKKVKINGDDIMYAGTAVLYQEWRRVTGKYGLEVNESKTELSTRWLDLNSQSFDVSRGKMVAKATLGFLRSNRNEPGALLRAIIVGMKGFALGHVLGVINMLRHEVSLRGVIEDLAEVGPWWRATLVKKRWFRVALESGKCAEIKTGQDRSLETCPGPPPRERFYKTITRMAAEAQRDQVKEWIGRRVKPLSIRLDRQSRKSLTKKNVLVNDMYIWKGFQWSFLWPKKLFVLINERFPRVFDRSNTKWKTDHPFLTRKPVGQVIKRKYVCSPPENLLPYWGLITSESQAV
ncbi:RNA-dependent RNA polymerase [Botrytis cinerea ourmia-like virus 16]|uniref:RNA-dependent RNA polymerase n=1 Tax=Botrytis cinerea ourmia-like virus 16 TaxID=2735950 RepID=A0ABX6P1C8_9VIRU|nr:RNA-dependent RNA polymerase [Botrytis cinerea ourmia-like virus 16]QJT73682.1 RNA-dependent RNA polymerase [Botrytis cinerea ourmia-like virus 16]